jgi:hypothetical protein
VKRNQSLRGGSHGDRREDRESRNRNCYLISIISHQLYGVRILIFVIVVRDAAYHRLEAPDMMIMIKLCVCSIISERVVEEALPGDILREVYRT